MTSLRISETADIDLPNGAVLTDVPLDENGELPSQAQVLDMAVALGLATPDDFPDISPEVYAKSLIANIPQSAKENTQAALSALANPVETFRAFAGLAVGIGQKLIPGEQKFEQFPDRLADFYKERYGTLDRAMYSLRNDPVGVALDGLTVLAPTTAALKMPAAAKGLAAAQTALDPLMLAGKVVGPASAEFIRRGGVMAGTRLLNLQKYIGFPIREMNYQGKRVNSQDVLTEILLRNKIDPTKKGFDKLRGDLAALREQQKAIVSRYGKSPILNRDQIMQPLMRELGDLKRKAKGVPAREEQVAVIEGFINELDSYFQRPDKVVEKTVFDYFSGEPKARVSREFVKESAPYLTLGDAVKMRQYIDKTRAEFEFFGGPENATLAETFERIRKKAADPLRAAIQKTAPDLSIVNREMSDLLLIEPYVARAATSASHESTPIRSVAIAGVGAASAASQGVTSTLGGALAITGGPAFIAGNTLAQSRVAGPLARRAQTAKREMIPLGQGLANAVSPSGTLRAQAAPVAAQAARQPSRMEQASIQASEQMPRQSIRAKIDQIMDDVLRNF